MNSMINKYIKLLSKYLKNNKLQIFCLAMVMGLCIVIQLLNPQIVKYFIDGVTVGKTTKNLIIAAVIFILFAFSQQLLNLVSTYLSQNIGWGATNELRLDLVKHCMGLDMSFFKEHQAGELVERIDGDVTALFNFFSKFVVTVLNNLLLIFGIIILLAIENLAIGIVFLIFLLLSFYVVIKTQKGTVGNFKENRELTAKFYGFLGESIFSTEDIRANGAEKYILDKFHTLLRNWLPICIKANLSGYRIWMTLEGIFSVGNIMIFGLGGYLWYKGSISIGTIYLMISYIQLLEKPLEQLRNQLQDMQKASASLIRVEELFATKSKIVNQSKNIFDAKDFSLRVEQISFSYEENSPVLKDISFMLPQGEVLGVLGHTGSGKTTLARLLVRFYDPEQGEIYIDNKSLKAIPIKALRKDIAYVTQEVQLFNASVRDNLTFFNKKMKDELIISTIYSMGLNGWYENLDNGLDTLLLPGGGGMSSGEAQLLALVRVFLRNPKLIILDEASSRLDPATESLLDKALVKLIEGRSCIIIAHRLDTVKKADKILILDKGTIAEYGDKEKLITDKDSRFNQLLESGIEEALC